MEDTLIRHNIDIFLFSPTIKTGVSVNAEYFDKCYAYGSSSSLCVREFFQMLFRFRNLKQKEINISFNSKFTRPKEYISTERISEILLNEPTITLYILYNLNENENGNKNIEKLLKIMSG